MECRLKILVRKGNYSSYSLSSVEFIFHNNNISFKKKKFFFLLEQKKIFAILVTNDIFTKKKKNSLNLSEESTKNRKLFVIVNRYV